MVTLSVTRPVISSDGLRAGVLFLLILLASLSSVAADTEVALQCDGREMMSVVMAEYGLVTASWAPACFEVGVRVRDERLPGGGPVRVWRFSNGDRLFHVDNTTDWFVTYSNAHPGLLRRCMFRGQRTLVPENLPRVPST
ncbi:TPA: hypothetical protein ACIVB1_000480 [Salmonella enterica subsp. diarizonae serovar 61:l,v:z35]